MHPIHPMAVHFPIALLSASVLFDLLSSRWRQEDMRVVSLYTLILGLCGAVVAVITGTVAEEAVEHSGVPEWILEIHETLGFASFWVFAGLLGLQVAQRLGWMRERRALSISLGLVAVAVLIIASYYGGSLVYEFGAGVMFQP